jgi:hypothetical protein
MDLETKIQQELWISNINSTRLYYWYGENVGSQFGGGGRKCALLKDILEGLKNCFDGKRDDDIAVTLWLMMVECEIFRILLLALF